MVIIVQTAKNKTLIIVKELLLFFIKYFIPMTKKRICAIRNGIVNISLKNPIKIESIL